MNLILEEGIVSDHKEKRLANLGNLTLKIKPPEIRRG